MFRSNPPAKAGGKNGSAEADRKGVFEADRKGVFLLQGNLSAVLLSSLMPTNSLRQRLLCGILIFFTCRCGLAAEPGDFDGAPFGAPTVLEKPDAKPVYAPRLTDGRPDTVIELAAGACVQIEWRQPRDVYVVRLRFAGDAPAAETVAIQYWYSVWPENGDGGWMKLDDPFNGEFITAATESKVEANALTFRFKRLEKAENPKLKHLGSDWRYTYKIRVGFKSTVRPAEIECLTDSVWKEADVRVEVPGDWDRRVEARNAKVTPIVADSGHAAFHARYAYNANRLSPDRGHLIVRRAGGGPDFSFFIDDVVREGMLKIRDVNAWVSDAAKSAEHSSWQKPSDAWDATVIEYVARLPEQTFDRAMREMPPKWSGDMYLGLPVLRQEIGLNGNSQINTSFWCLRGPAGDTARAPLLSNDEQDRVYNLITRKEPFGPPGSKSIRRWLEDGFLPVVHSTWQHEGIEYHQTVYATALDPAVLAASLALPESPPQPLGPGPQSADFGSGLRGDEAIAAMSRLELHNAESTPRTATLWLKISRRPPMHIDEHGVFVLEKPTRPPAGPDLTPVWGQIDTRGKGELVYLPEHFPDTPDRKEPRDLIRYSLPLQPDERHAIVLKVPYIEQMTATELKQFKALDWDEGFRAVTTLWKQRLASAMDDYNVPEPALVNLYRANLWHVLITTDRDVPTGLYEHGASTCHYPMYANETMMVMRSLEMRGEHEEARRLIEPYLLSQGAKALPGNFKSQEGLLYAAAPKGHDHYTAQGYNMHHGFLLWAAAEHYLWTRDRKYLEDAAPHLVAACDWITRERKATMVLNPDGSRPLEFGLAPAGDLEDVGEYLWFYATNAYYYLGMKTAAAALADIGHAEAGRLAADAESYARDIRASVREAAATDPVVQLLDGTYAPFVPARPYVLTDRKEGWIREALYSSLHLVDAGLIEPDDQMATWILNELEDRIFMSEESGYGPRRGLKNPREQFFTFGGFNPQPNLLSTPLVYLQRGQVPNFVRGFINTFAVSYYSDTCSFIEALLTFGEGASPMYKTPDESRFIQTMRQMLVLEMGDKLYLGRGVPRAWMAAGKTVEFKHAPTYFGPVSLKITPSDDARAIRAELELPTRNPPKTSVVSLRHVDGRKIASVRVNDRDWSQFDPSSDMVTLPNDTPKVVVVAKYK